MTDLRLTPDIITLYSTGRCPDCKRSKQFFGEMRPYSDIYIEQDLETMVFGEKTNKGDIKPLQEQVFAV